MIPYNITNVKKSTGKPLYASVEQNSSFTTDDILKAYYTQKGMQIRVTFDDPVNKTKYFPGCKVEITDCEYNGIYKVVEVSDTQMYLSYQGHSTSPKLSQNGESGGKIKPLGPVDVVLKQGTPIQNSDGSIVAITYTGNNSFISDSGEKLAKVFQVIATAGSVAVTIKWSLDGVNYSDFSPALSGSGTSLGFLVNLSHINCLLKISVVSAGTYYVMEG